MSEFNTALEYVEAALADKKTIEFGDDEFVLTVNENIDINDVYNAINNIVENVVEREFEYELIDLMIPYYLISLFTDIDVTTIKDGDEEYPDYEQCYKIATVFNLEYELTQVSPLVAGYIYLMNQNIWRRLDYQKSQGAYLKRELMDAISTFYMIMDELDEVAEQQKDIDVDGFVSQLNEISEALQDLNTQKSESLAVLDGGKTSVDLALPKSDQEE